MTALLGWDGHEIRAWDMGSLRPLGVACPFEGPASWDENDGAVEIEFDSTGALILTSISVRSDSEGPNSRAQSWSAITGKPFGPPVQFEGRPGGAGVAFSPDGKSVLVRLNAREAKISNVKTGTPVLDKISPQNGVTSVAFSPDGSKFLIGGSRGIVEERGFPVGEVVGEPFRVPLRDSQVAATYSRDGRAVLITGGESAWFCDVGSRQIQSIANFENDTTNLFEDFTSGGICVYKDLLRPTILDSSTGRAVSGWRFHRMDQSWTMTNDKGKTRWIKGTYYTIKFDPIHSILLYAQQIGDEYYSGLWDLGTAKGSKKLVRYRTELLARAVAVNDEQDHLLDETAWQEHRLKFKQIASQENIPLGTIKAAEDSTYWLRCEANLAEKELRWSDATRLLSRLTEVEPLGWRNYLRLGDALGRLGKYREAANALLHARELDGGRVTQSMTWWHQTGLALLGAGDREAHRVLCRELRAHLGQSGQNPSAWTDNFTDSDTLHLLPLFVTSSQPSEGWEALLAKFRAGDDLLSVGSLLLRAGQFRESSDCLERAVFQGGDLGGTFGQAFLALAKYKLGDQAEANKHFTATKSLLADYRTAYLNWSYWDGGQYGWTWQDMLSLKLITDEAEELISGHPPSFNN